MVKNPKLDLTRLRRTGKSVMVNLIQREFFAAGVNEDSFIFDTFSSLQ